MKGFILSLYLDNNITPTNNREEFQYMSWSPYDRIEIKEVKSFAEFFNAQFQTKWIGVAQQMHLLHEYPDEYTWMIGDKTGQNVLIGTVFFVKRTAKYITAHQAVYNIRHRGSIS